MKIITGKNYESVALSLETILFPEYGKNREELKEFVKNLQGNEIIVTSSLELIDLILERFKRDEQSFVLYSDSGKRLRFKEAYELRKYLDFDLRGAKFREMKNVSVLFCEGKTDAKFFKASYKKLFGFKESKEIPENLKLIERLFERDNFEILRKEDKFLAIIPSEGNAGVIRNVGIFLKAMDVYGFTVQKIGLAIDIDDSEERVLESIKGKLSSFRCKEENGLFKVGESLIVPLLIGVKIELSPCIEWEKPTIEDLMLEVLNEERVLRRIDRAINILYVDLRRKLKPKEVIYLTMAAKRFWGNLEGFYEMMLMRSRKENLEKVLIRAGILDKLEFLSY